MVNSVVQMADDCCSTMRCKTIIKDQQRNPLFGFLVDQNNLKFLETEYIGVGNLISDAFTDRGKGSRTLPFMTGDISHEVCVEISLPPR